MEDNCGGRGSWADEDDDEEALSLTDLPLIHRKDKVDEDINPQSEAQNQEEFDFCSLSKESEMCAADEVFFQGQILPFRHSVSSERGLLLHCCHARNPTRSESMDHHYSGLLISSRSSSISSHHSSTSSSSRSRPRLPPRIQFHSHPSPSPRIPFPRPQPPGPTNHRNFPQKSSLWNFFRVGLVASPPEIAFQDLRKSRCPNSITGTNCRNFGSRNSTGSHNSSVVSISSGKAKKKARRVSFFAGGSCKCASDAVGTVPSKVVTIKRSARDGELVAIDRHHQIIAQDASTTTAAKKQLSHHRTFEWLKQLSVEGAPHEA